MLTIFSSRSCTFSGSAAKQGHPDAQFCLGQMYQQAFGLNENDRMAAKWYRRAAEHVPDLGDAGQRRNGLAILYQRGTGVPKDYLKAYMWLSLAKGDLFDLKTQMTPAEILDAERMANEWNSHHRTP
jgi:TPR repeat protein